MQPILTFVAGAVGFGVSFWIVRSALRYFFPSLSQNSFGVALITVGLWLLVVRLVVFAIPLFMLGFALLSPRNARTAAKSPKQTSQVRSAHLEMSLDHETGVIDGRILTGNLQGQILSDLERQDLLRFYIEIQADADTVKLLETFLDSAHPDWRDHMEERTTRDEAASPLSEKLSRDEAFRLLGLEEGSSAEEIREAYHRLIKRVHPDRGGSAALTAQITEARNKLLGDRRSPD
ncbi:J domain-containing protein [Tateyamaria pelophila]|uniref:J domain-containing protein n=1 Tax=Tateyamaria pelophila TaxID=328415 RepID=UPI001CBB618B|nr:DnaJ domain-containing protein [Tateyamaria pelophila]